MRIRILIFISIFLSSLHAQNSMYQKHPDVNPITPDVATLTNYINFPVNYYGGLVDVNIPLFEIKAGDITIPISLSYHSGGYHPEDPLNVTYIDVAVVAPNNLYNATMKLPGAKRISGPTSVVAKPYLEYFGK